VEAIAKTNHIDEVPQAPQRRIVEQAAAPAQKLEALFRGDIWHGTRACILLRAIIKLAAGWGKKRVWEGARLGNLQCCTNILNALVCVRSVLGAEFDSAIVANGEELDSHSDLERHFLGGERLGRRSNHAVLQAMNSAQSFEKRTTCELNADARRGSTPHEQIAVGNKTAKESKLKENEGKVLADGVSQVKMQCNGAITGRSGMDALDKQSDGNRTVDMYGRIVRLLLVAQLSDLKRLSGTGMVRREDIDTI
jgi:hypothetical protein